MLGNFGEVRSALGQSSIGNQAHRNYTQRSKLAGDALQQEALYRANLYKAKVLEETKGRMNPVQGNSTSPLQGILGDGISLAKEIFAANKGGGSGTDFVNSFGSLGDFNRLDLETSFAEPMQSFGMNLFTP